MTSARRRQITPSVYKVKVGVLSRPPRECDPLNAGLSRRFLEPLSVLPDEVSDVVEQAFSVDIARRQHR